ncbi:hypothetical protein EJ02DRAFT_425862 [Clathrospora elynae]|uniref:BZIP domain-containing protein n=1 Tax=Clathrospora elynae TaxID=706981 RepID=A0A6A5SF20_9PLEO|nr:hypothetical protein EJ02DRAFT_425862 [Clathrospora elynae]
MLKKGNDTPSSVRIRENQRRSRNQRKELIKDLQNRVKEYELKGIVATQDMQQAARRVAVENKRLRSLLASHGVAQEEVESYLQSFDEAAASSHYEGIVNGTPAPRQPGPADRITDPMRYAPQPQPQPQPSAPFPHARQPPIGSLQHITHDKEGVEVTAQRSYELGLYTEPGKPAFTRGADDRNGCPDDNAMHDSNAHALPTEEEDTECPNTSSCFCPPATTTRNRPMDNGLLISCEVAATIIAEMRGDEDRHQIRASLGCQGQEECNVKNFVVMELMDER